MDLPTPLYRLTDQYADQVYEPAEDTFLLLDALQLDVDQIRQRNPLIIIELGTGSGVVSTFVSQLCAALNHNSNTVGNNNNINSSNRNNNSSSNSCFVISTDINPTAADCCKTTANMNGRSNICPVVTNVSEALQWRLLGQVDLIICNPPYVPTDDSEVNDPSDSLTRAWAGGRKGRIVIDRLVPLVAPLLVDGGLFYLLLIHENDIPEVRSRFCPSLFSSADLIIKRQCGRELLYVVRFVK